MPTDSTRNTLVRQWELLKLLPSRGAGKTAKDLAEALNDAGFKVSKRQVERDLQALRESFPLDCNDKSPPYGWRWVEGASAELPGLTLTESLSLRLVEDTLRPLLPTQVLRGVEDRFRQAEKKLAGLANDNDLAAWPDKVRVVPPVLPLLPPMIPEGVLEGIQNALLHDRRIEADYTRRGRTEPKTLVLNPLALVQSGPVSFLVAIAQGFEEARLYAVHRFSRVAVLDDKLTRPANFDLDALIQAGLFQFGKLSEIKLEAQVTAPLQRILSETPLSTDQSLAPSEDERFTLTATVTDSQLLRRWLLSRPCKTPQGRINRGIQDGIEHPNPPGIEIIRAET